MCILSFVLCSKEKECSNVSLLFCYIHSLPRLPVFFESRCSFLVQEWGSCKISLFPQEREMHLLIFCCIRDTPPDGCVKSDFSRFFYNWSAKYSTDPMLFPEAVQL